LRNTGGYEKVEAHLSHKNEEDLIRKKGDFQFVEREKEKLREWTREMEKTRVKREEEEKPEQDEGESRSLKDSKKTEGQQSSYKSQDLSSSRAKTKEETSKPNGDPLLPIERRRSCNIDKAVTEDAFQETVEEQPGKEEVEEDGHLLQEIVETRRRSSSKEERVERKTSKEDSLSRTEEGFPSTQENRSLGLAQVKSSSL